VFKYSTFAGQREESLEKINDRIDQPLSGRPVLIFTTEREIPPDA
jgi:hypothetical protein